VRNEQRADHRFSTDCDAASKAVVDFETAVSKATQDVWSVVQIPRWSKRSIHDPVSIRHAYTKVGKDFPGCYISVQVCWKEEERRKAADSGTKVRAQRHLSRRLPTSILGHLVKRTTIITTITPLTRAGVLLISFQRTSYHGSGFENTVAASCGTWRHTVNRKTGRPFGLSDPVNNEY
jgi:hypothetical protein